MAPSVPFRSPGDGSADRHPAIPDPATEMVTDSERERAALLLQRACGEGRLTLEEFSDRVGEVWAAATPQALASATAELTTPVVTGSRGPDTRLMIRILGDGRRTGRWRVPRRSRLVSLLGDWKIDFRGALVSEAAMRDGFIDLTFISLLGDLKVIVPEGVEVELAGFCLLGDERLDLAPVPLLPGAPRLRVRVFGLLGDVVVRSAPAGS